MAGSSSQIAIFIILITTFCFQNIKYKEEGQPLCNEMLLFCNEMAKQEGGNGKPQSRRPTMQTTSFYAILTLRNCREQIGEYDAMKRKIALAVAVIGVLVLLLHSCQKNTGENLSAEEVQQKAYEYLASRYSGEFTIINRWCMPANNSPIPNIIPSYYYELEVVSDQFPEETFQLYYRKNHNSFGWSWSDNYYTLLLREEMQEYFSEIIEKYFETDYIFDCVWGATIWPDGTEEGTSLQEWLEAGGHITDIRIYLREITLVDEICKPLAEEILNTAHSIGSVTFYNMDGEVFDQAYSVYRPDNTLFLKSSKQN